MKSFCVGYILPKTIKFKIRINLCKIRSEWREENALNFQNCSVNCVDCFFGGVVTGGNGIAFASKKSDTRHGGYDRRAVFYRRHAHGLRHQ